MENMMEQLVIGVGLELGRGAQGGSSLWSRMKLRRTELRAWGGSCI